MTITRDDIESGRVVFTDEDGPLMDPIHPGEHLAEFLADLDCSATIWVRFARRSGWWFGVAAKG